MRYTLCGRRSQSSPTSGDGQSRLKNCPGLTASAFGEASTMRCLYSLLIRSCETIGHRVSSVGICASDGDGALLPTTNGAEAKGWACMRKGPVSGVRQHHNCRCTKIKIYSNF